MAETKPETPKVKTFQVACPECECDYLIPLMRLIFVKSFAGNRIQCEWPTRKDINDSALVVCPACATMIKVTEDGQFKVLDHKWTVKTK